ncbi:DUF4012 domain-containing protein [Bifidobacterium choerinum]|uniref:DUF4012 domain-containing protein n=1 Tax=Bifidobacterium choerinum TaxID=35760 RepID=UPI003F91E4A3
MCDRITARIKRVRWWQWLIVAMAAFLVAIAGVYAVQAVQIRNHELAAADAVKHAVSEGEFTDVESIVGQMRGEIAAARDIAHNGWWNAAAGLPGVGHDVRTMQRMTDVVADLAEQTVPQYANLAGQLDPKTLFHGGRINADALVELEPALAKANKSLNDHITEYDAIERAHMGVVAGAYDSGRDMLAAAKKVTTMASDIVLPNIRTWLGYDKIQTYAVLAMTTAEMRGSGGLVGSVGTVTFDHGKITIGDFMSNVELLDYKATNVSKDEYALYQLDGPIRLRYDVRDVTNAPSTKRVAELFRNIWNQAPLGDDVALDGIVLADPVFVQSLVKALGDVKLQDGTVLTGENTAEYLLNTVYKDHAFDDTDGVFSAVAKDCVRRLMNDMSPRALASFAKDLPMLTRYRHLNAYSFNKSLETVFTDLGLTANVPRDAANPQVGIYLTEKNPSKVGWYIQRSTTVAQTNCESSGPATYHVEYTLTNTLTEEEQKKLSSYVTGDWGAYPDRGGSGMETIVFYPPAGGQLKDFRVTGGGSAPTTGTLEWAEVFHTYVQLRPGQTVTYSFDVVASKDATQKLEVDETPTGKKTADVKYTYLCPVG